MSLIMVNHLQWIRRGMLAVAIGLSGHGCYDAERAQRRLPAPDGSRTLALPTSDLSAGPIAPDTVIRNPYTGDPYAIEEGRRLFGWYNCAGCHGASGGGGIGPPLRDAAWIYGGTPGNIFQSIVLGRPNGMPAYQRRLTDDHIWKVVAYIQTLSPQAAAERMLPGDGPDRPDTTAVQAHGESAP